MIGPFGWEPVEAYVQKHRTILAPEVCICKDCVAAGIAMQSVLSAEQKQRVDVGGHVREMWMGRWLHGNERKQYEEYRERFRAAVEKMHVYKMPEATQEDYEQRDEVRDPDSGS